MQVFGRYSSLWGVALAVALAACGEVKGNNNSPDAGSNVDPDADFTLTVDPASLTIPIAGSAKVTVTVARSGGNTGDIALSATGLGANLTADFSPAAIPDGSTSAEVTIKVKGGTAAATSTVTITGTAGDKTHSADVSVTSTTITVSGVVRGNRAGVKVGIAGKQSVTSGAGGVFTFTDVTPPYDLYTFVDSGCSSSTTPTVYYFDDLTRPDPIVSAGPYTPTCATKVLPCFLQGCPNTNVSGSKAGAGNNTDELVWSWSEGGLGSIVLNPNGTYSLNASWNGASPRTGFLGAIQLTRKQNGAPNAFLGYVRKQVTLTSGTASTNETLTFSTINSTGTVTGTLNAPPGYPAPSVTLFQEFGAVNMILWSAETTAIDAVFPRVPTLGANNLYASSTLDNGVSQYSYPLAASSTVNFNMPAAAVLDMPADGATGVTATTKFTWTAPTGVISELNVFSTGATRAAFRVFTTKSEATVPVVSELAMPSGMPFNWRVAGYGPNQTIDEAVTENELAPVLVNDYAGAPHAFTQSTTRAFTSQ